MQWEIIISSAFVLAGTIVTVIASNKKTKTEIQLKQAYNEEQIRELKETVKEHNDYAKNIPAIKVEIDNIKESIAYLKEKI